MSKSFNEKFADFYAKNSTRKVLSSLISILIGIVFGALVVFLVGLFKPDIPVKSAWEGVRIVLFGIFSTGRNAAGGLSWGFNSMNIGNMLFRSAPVIMTGLSVAVAFKTGLFNIGAAGQYLMGSMTCLIVALSIPSSSCPAWIIWILAFLAALLAGAIWGAIPGLLKSLFNINEVIACIMTNWIAANVVSWVFDKSVFRNAEEVGKLGYIYKTSKNGVATVTLGLDKLFKGSQANAGIFIAILIAVGMYILMNKTTFGFQLRACGSNRYAAKYAGIADKRNIVFSMAISGSLAAGGAALYYLSGSPELAWNTYQSLPAYGFNGIPIALLAQNNPIGVIFAGIFMAILDIVGIQLTKLTAYNEYITSIIIAVIVYLSAFSLVIEMWLVKLGKKKQEEKEILEEKENEEKKAEAEKAEENKAKEENE